MQTTRWWWIRHAPVTTDGGRVYGQRDLPADTSNARAFEGLAAAMPRRAVWVTSHLQRTDQPLAEDLPLIREIRAYLKDNRNLRAGSADRYLERVVCVRGTVGEFEGAASVVVSDPSDIWRD